MNIPFTKAHGARNDFLLSWQSDVPSTDLPALSRAICDRYTGVGADGWLLVSKDPECHAAITLYNSDGSLAEMSGNGTRCAAAFLLHGGLEAETIRIRTGAGPKQMRLLGREGLEYMFEMNMGRAEVRDPHFKLPITGVPAEAVLLWVGNPQCAVPVENFDFDWRAAGAAIERHPVFPNRTNVSFVRPVDAHTVEVRFWERGAGETMSSGTGSTGAAAAAAVLGMASSPIRVVTPAGPLELRLEGDIFLTGPAAIVAEGQFIV